MIPHGKASGVQQILVYWEGKHFNRMVHGGGLIRIRGGGGEFHEGGVQSTDPRIMTPEEMCDWI